MKKKEEHTHIKKYMYMSDANIIADDRLLETLFLKAPSTPIRPKSAYFYYKSRMVVEWRS